MAGSDCRRRAILEHFGDSAPGAPTGRCCDVCDPDQALIAAVQSAPVAARRRTRAGGGRAGSRAGALPGVGSADGAGADVDAPGPPVDEREFELLRAWRMERAAGLPAYTVAANGVLEEILRRRPRSTGELIEIKGIGPAFCEKHG